MVILANDGHDQRQELPATRSRRGPTLNSILALPAAQRCEASAVSRAELTAVRRVVRTGLAELTAEPESVAALRLAGVLVLLAAGRAKADADQVVQALVQAGAAVVALDGKGRRDLDLWRGACQTARLPLLIAAGPQALEDLRAETTEAILDHQGRLLEREDDMHAVLVQIVLEGGSLTDLCQAIATFFGGAAIVATTDGRVIADAGPDGELERIKALDCFHRSGRLIVEKERVGVRRPDDPANNRALVRIAAGPSEQGLLGAFSPDRALTAADVHLLERAATVAALAITKEQAVAAVESKYRAEFLRDSLAGRSGPPAETVSHAASLGWDLDRPMVVVVAETDENDAETTREPEEVRQLQERYVRAWVRAVRTKDTSIPVAGFSQEVVVLLPVAESADADAVLASVGELIRVVRGDGGGGRRTFSTGVSRTVSAVHELPAAYSQALHAAQVGRQMHGDSAVVHADRMGIYRLLALISDGAALRAFVEEALGDLATDADEEYADLRQTLNVLLDSNLNVAETARKLFFHYNTLRYRIAKLERMLGPFTTDPQLRLTLSVALRIHEMRGI